MTGSNGGPGGRTPGDGSGRHEDEEATIVRHQTPPTSPGGQPQLPPAAPNSPGWGADPSQPSGYPNAGHPQGPPGTGYPASGAGYGPPAGGTGYGPPAGGTGYGPPAGGSGYGPPAGGTGYGQPPQGSGYGPPTSGAGYGQPPQGSGYGPPPTGGAGYGQPSGSEGVPPSGSGRRKKPLIIGLVAGVVVLVVVGLVLAFTSFGGSSSPGSESAGDTVKGYLEALADGDAEAALSYSDNQPGNKDLLTDDILKKQIGEWPITDIRILNDDTSAESIGMGQVHVTAKFGDKTSDTTLQVKKNGDGKWRLDSAAIKVSSMPGGISNAAAQTLTVFGKPAGENTLYVFPGYLDIGSSNEYLEVKTKDPLLLDKLGSYSSPYLQPDIQLSDSGTEAVMDQLKGDLAACRQFHTDAPPKPCPVKLSYGFSDAFVTWGAADISDVKVKNFNEYQLEAMLSGEVTIQVTTDGKPGTIDPFLSATADLTKSPPVIDYG